MTESYQEQHPLLYEDLSEEEQFSPRYKRRFRPMVYQGRARNNVKGAAAIIRLWPEHWSSSVTYWWIGLAMIGIITIIVYNSVVVLALLPPENFKELRLRTAKTVNPVLDDTQFSLNIYMHLFVDNNQEVDLNNYMPYIDIIANKYSDFKYHLIIVRNDTIQMTNTLSAEQNNEMALNLLWTKNSVHDSEKNNIVIEQIALTKYMNNSPLRQYWINLPKQFTQFLIRAVSIWDKGGIAFNPTILTPRSPHASYIEKIQNILKNYNHNSKKNLVDRKIIKNKNGFKKKVNNIRDIIDALEQDNEEQYDLPTKSSLDFNFDLDIKHNVREASINSNIPHYPVHSTINGTTDYQKLHPKFKNVIKNKSEVIVKSFDSKETLVMSDSNVNNVSVHLQENNNTSAIGILPMFLEFLFRNKPVLDSDKKVHDELTTVTRKRKHVPVDSLPDDYNSNSNRSSVHPEKKLSEKSKPLILSSKAIHDSDKNIEVNKENNDDGNQLTIDLKGNIVSSATPCHAFLGTMFSNAVHHTQESLTDFIITELSIFCKGALSSCKGIDVILL